eukprot:gene12437-13723_t
MLTRDDSENNSIAVERIRESVQAAEPENFVASFESPISLLISSDKGRKIVLDKNDFHQITHDMTETHKDNDVHYCSHMATENRISGKHLDDTKPIGDVMSLENGVFSPSKSEHQHQRNNYITLVSRYITDEIECSKFSQGVVIRNIPHIYTEETKQKTDTTYLGIIYENENTCDGMGKILETMHQYVPCCEDQEDKKFSSQAIVGDQLTVERGVNGLMDVSNGFTSEERREGLHVEIADFHGGIKFHFHIFIENRDARGSKKCLLELIYETFYHSQSASDKCTLYCERNVIDRRNISTDVKHRVSQSKKFLNLAVKARVIPAALKLLDLTSVDGLPTQCTIITVNEKSTKAGKKNFLHSLASEIVDKFILRAEQVEQTLEKIETEREHEKQKGQKNFNCRFPGCNKIFKYDGKTRKEHEATHEIKSCKSSPTTIENRDDMYNYQLALLEIGMLIQNFFDAISEGDGEGILRSWKFFLPYLRNDGKGSSKYALEAFFMMCQVNALLTPKAAHELKWNRFCKNKNGQGGNIPLELALEHHNKLIKTLMQNLGPNATNKHCLSRFIKALRVNKDVLDSFDQQVFFKKRSGDHKRRCEKADLNKVVNELVKMMHLHKRIIGSTSTFLMLLTACCMVLTCMACSSGLMTIKRKFCKKVSKIIPVETITNINSV